MPENCRGHSFAANTVTAYKASMSDMRNVLLSMGHDIPLVGAGRPKKYISTMADEEDREIEVEIIARELLQALAQSKPRRKWMEY